MPNTKIITLRSGYAESGSMAMLVFCNGNVEFETRMQALQSFAHTLLLKWMEDEEVRIEQNDCCAEFLLRAKETDKRCPQCGRVLDVEVDLEHFENFVRGLVFSDTDQWGLDLSEFTTPWTEYVSIQEIQDAGNEVLELGEYGERQVVAALRGDELEHSAFKKAVEQFWEGGAPWFPGSKSREEFAKCIEGRVQE